MAIQEINLGADDGFADVTIGGATQRIDVTKVHAQIYEAQRQSVGAGYAPFYDRVAEQLAKLGFGEVSHKMAVAFVAFINSRMAVADAQDEARDEGADPAAGPPAADAPAEPQPA